MSWGQMARGVLAGLLGLGVVMIQGGGVGGAPAPAPALAAPQSAETTAAPSPTPLDLEAVEQALRREESERARLAEQAASTEQELKTLSDKLVAAARRVQDQEEILSRLEERLADLRWDQTALRDTLERREDQVRQVVTAVERLAWRPTEALLAQPASPSDTVRVAILMRSAIPRIEESARLLKAELRSLAGLNAAILAQRAQIKATSDTLRAEHASLRALAEEKRGLVQDLRARSQAAEDRMARLSREAQDLRDLLARLEREKRARAERERLRRERAHLERLAALAVRPKPPTPEPRRAPPEPPPESSPEAATAEAGASAANPANPATTQTPPTPAALTQLPANPDRDRPLPSFAKAKGRMPFPVRGRVLGLYGERSDLGEVLRGLRIATRPDGQVIAPHDGRVAFAGPFRSYGNLLILDHGEGYHTLLAGLGRIDVGVGQRLAAGEPVGTMPALDDRGGAPVLYVELRRKGQPINPRPWLTASKGNASG